MIPPGQVGQYLLLSNVSNETGAAANGNKTRRWRFQRRTMEKVQWSIRRTRAAVGERVDALIGSHILGQYGAIVGTATVRDQLIVVGDAHRRENNPIFFRSLTGTFPQPIDGTSSYNSYSSRGAPLLQTMDNFAVGCKMWRMTCGAQRTQFLLQPAQLADTLGHLFDVLIEQRIYLSVFRMDPWLDAVSRARGKRTRKKLKNHNWFESGEAVALMKKLATKPMRPSQLIKALGADASKLSTSEMNRFTWAATSAINAAINSKTWCGPRTARSARRASIVLGLKAICWNAPGARTGCCAKR